MDQVFTGLHEAHRQLLEEGKIITSASVKAKYLWEDEEEGKTLLGLITYHSTTMHTSLKAGTMKNYFIRERCIKRFLEDEYHIEDIPLKILDYRFNADYEQYVRQYKPSTRTGCTNNGAMKHMERFKNTRFLCYLKLGKLLLSIRMNLVYLRMAIKTWYG